MLGLPQFIYQWGGILHCRIREFWRHWRASLCHGSLSGSKAILLSMGQWHIWSRAKYQPMVSCCRHQRGTNSITLYLNGTNVASGSLPFDTPAGSQLFIGGISAPFNTRQMVGLIDEVSIYNRALTPAEIQSIYNAGSAGKCTSASPAVPAISNFMPASGTNGTVVTISGTNFSPVVAGNIVRFGAPRLRAQRQPNFIDRCGSFRSRPKSVNSDCKRADGLC